MADILFWVTTIALAIAVTGLMIAAAARGRQNQAPVDSDLKVYKDQLRDVERDLGRGLIATEEAARLRTEIGRRVLAADTAARAALAGQAGGPSQLWTLMLILPVVLGVGYGIYYMKGHPQWGDQPIASRLEQTEANRAARLPQAEAEARFAEVRPAAPAADPRHAELVEELRRAVAQRPDDLQGNRLLARNEALLGNHGAAARAQANINRLLGDQVTLPDLETEAELMIMATGGRISPEAEAVLARILTKDGSNKLARYYSGLSLAETGRYDLAFRFWAPLWTDSTPNDPWVPILERELPDLAWAAGQHRYQMPPMAVATRGPDAAAIEAAQDMSPEARDQMVRGMVDGLMARLGSSGGTGPEWAQLIRALGVLKDTERGQAILLEARQRFVAHPEDLALINAAGAEAGFQ